MSNKNFYGLFLGGLALALLVILAPTFQLAPRADHMFYMIETAELNSFADLFNFSVSHNRTRLFFPGDYIYFRPLFYVGMALEQFAFRYQFALWQITGIGLHFLVCASLLRLLALIHPNRTLAACATLFFAFTYVSAEAVLWTHINMYMMCYLLIIWALIHLMHFWRKDRPPAQSYWRAWACMAAACFFNEFGVIASLIILFMLHRQAKGRYAKQTHPLYFLLPVLFYGYLSYVDFRLHLPDTPFLNEGVGLPSVIHILPMAIHTLSVIGLAATLPFVPGLYTIAATERNTLLLLSAQQFRDVLPAINPISIANGTFVLLIAYVFIIFVKNRTTIKQSCNLPQGEHAVLKSIRALSLTLACGYAAALVFLRGTSTYYAFYLYLAQSLYHFYPIILLGTVFLYCLLVPIGRSHIPVRTSIIGTITILFCLAAAFNALKLGELAEHNRRAFGSLGQVIQQTDLFIDEHRDEPGFSIDLVNQHEYSRIYTYRIGLPPHQEDISSYYADLLFRQHINKKNPSFRLHFDTAQQTLSIFDNSGKKVLH